ncbi:hypothetical protein OH76DRAFT_1483676 [Lentinus brumalis]|uniref:Uncharacterized protein n=1 Tax=Lentinus brumalis TaxID=2498619 RepID=A0A371D8N8_9APHY|nr:hypothetical protein OH76DRAFT_1483676 [Polyporus brumalis]
MPGQRPSSASADTRDTRSSAGQAHSVSGKRPSAAATRLRELHFREYARTLAGRKPAVAPLCSHRLKTDVQYLPGDTNDGRFIGKCGREGCVAVQYLSKKLSAKELAELNAQRPAGLFEPLPEPLPAAVLRDVTNILQEWDVLGYQKNNQTAKHYTVLPWTRLRDALRGWCPDMEDTETIAWCTTSGRTWAFIRVKDIRSETIELEDGDILVWTREDVMILPDLPTYAPGLGVPDWSDFWQNVTRDMSPTE